jgi:hypothetical protein
MKDLLSTPLLLFFSFWYRFRTSPVDLLLLFKLLQNCGVCKISKYELGRTTKMPAEIGNRTTTVQYTIHVVYVMK